jgi:hypothetical protein
VRKGADRTAAAGRAGRAALDMCRSTDPKLRELLQPPDDDGGDKAE